MIQEEAGIIRLKTVNSTNTRLCSLGRDGAPAWTVCTAEEQTSGRGRLDRVWHSPAGQGLWMSILLRPALPIAETGLLSFCAALAVSDALKTAARVDTAVKWPNDLVCGSRKICGILSTNCMMPDGSYFSVIGVGINLTKDAYPDELKDRATSVEEENGTPDREEMIRLFRERLRYYSGLLETGRRAELIAMTSARCVTLGKKVQVTGAVETAGTAEAIGSDGELILLTENGKRETVLCGDVSVRGVMGYV